MEDSLSAKSSDSAATSDEYDFLCPGGKTPTLELCDGLDGLTEALREAGGMEEGGTRKVGQSMFYGCPVEPGEDPLSAEKVPEVEAKMEAKPEGSDEEGEEFVGVWYNIFKQYLLKYLFIVSFDKIGRSRFVFASRSVFTNKHLYQKKVFIFQVTELLVLYENLIKVKSYSIILQTND